MRIRPGSLAIALLLFAACGDGSVGGDPVPAPPSPTPAPRPTAAPLTATLTHDFGRYELGPGEEVASQCVSWTLGNEQSLWVSGVTISNQGAFHHSNWFVVPDDMYEGPDGYWNLSLIHI